MRLSYKTVDYYIGILRSIFHAICRDGEWDKHLSLGNPAANKSVKDYLCLITAEQLQSSCRLGLHLDRQLVFFFISSVSRLLISTRN